MNDRIALDRTSDPSGRPSGSASAERAERLRRLRPHLACPLCGGYLEDAAGALGCRECRRTFPVLDGVPLLVPEVSPEWAEQRERKVRFARRTGWRRRLLNPDITSKRLQQRRLAEFLAPYDPPAIVLDVGSSLLRRTDAIVCFDLIPTPEVDLVGDLQRMPLADSSVDAVVCTGVLEHVENPERAVAEFARILKPDGRIYVSLPFLQGYHPSPTDFRRYTRDGARQLMRSFDIELLASTRGSASTVTWVLSSFLAELVSFGRPRLYAVSRALFGWLLLPLKYLDYLADDPFDHFIASGFTVIARRPRLDGNAAP
jgi:SAM-dependent methyltransferase